MHACSSGAQHSEQVWKQPGTHNRCAHDRLQHRTIARKGAARQLAHLLWRMAVGWPRDGERVQADCGVEVEVQDELLIRIALQQQLHVFTVPLRTHLQINLMGDRSMRAQARLQASS